VFQFIYILKGLERTLPCQRIVQVGGWIADQHRATSAGHMSWP